MKILCSGTQCWRFQFLLILYLWGISFHAVVVFDLGKQAWCKDLLFKSVLGHCALERFFYHTRTILVTKIHSLQKLCWFFVKSSYVILTDFCIPPLETWQPILLKLVSHELIHFGVIARLFRQIGGHSSRFVPFCSFWRLRGSKLARLLKWIDNHDAESTKIGHNWRKWNDWKSELSKNVNCKNLPTLLFFNEIQFWPKI